MPEESSNRRLSTLDPLLLAKNIMQEQSGIVRWQGSFWIWNDGSYHPMRDDSVRKMVYLALEEQENRITRNRVTDVVDAMRAVCHIRDNIEPPAYLDSDDQIGFGKVALVNGVLNLCTGKVVAPTPNLFTLSALPVAYDPEAKCPEWIRFLFDLWPNDLEAVETLQEVFGYFISGETDQHKLFLLVGPKRAGKGTLLRVLTALLGKENVAAPTLASLSQPFGLQPLIGKLAGLISDARLGTRADQGAIAERLLSISGEDHVSIPRKFLQDFTAQLKTRFILATNELPRLHDSSGALTSRFIPFILSRSWYGEENRELTNCLLSELQGILVWAMEGYRRLHKRGYFRIPTSAQESMQELQNLGSPIGSFVHDRCIIDPRGEVSCRELYQEWRRWCEEYGIEHPGTEQSFGRDLRAAVPGLSTSNVRWNNGRIRIYRGIRILHRN